MTLSEEEKKKRDLVQKAIYNAEQTQIINFGFGNCIVILEIELDTIIDRIVRMQEGEDLDD